MNIPNEICRLDYFAGTIATAYKGVITALVAKDFCITAAKETVELKGTIIAMPAGNYEARLISGGAELARNAIDDGSFVLTVKEAALRAAKGLQIDIVQGGRHIGTFLLRQESAAGAYVPAMALSEDLKDLKTRELTAGLLSRPGLLKKAEDLLAHIISAKKDLKAISEDIRSFSKELFWSDEAVFFAWYPVFAKWTAKACSGADGQRAVRAADNLLALAELLLDNQDRCNNTGALINTWLEAAHSAGPVLASRFMRTAEILRRINSGLPQADISLLATALLKSLKNNIRKAPALTGRQLAIIGRAVGADGLGQLHRYRSDRKRGILLQVEGFLKGIRVRDYAGLFRAANQSAGFEFDAADMTERILDMISAGLGTERGQYTAQAVICTLGFLTRLSEDERKRALSGLGRLIVTMIGLEMDEQVGRIMADMGKYNGDVTMQMLLNMDVASAIFSSAGPALTGQYTTMLSQLYIPAPGPAGFSRVTWAELVNPLHLEMLSKYFSLLGAAGTNGNGLLLHLLCNIFVSGIHIPDDRLFQREVSAYLNSGALRSGFLFNLILLERLPVYFNEVGAASVLRDATTSIDSWSDDPVLYFLRKQVHANASNYNVNLVRQIISAWVMNEKGLLKEALPEDVYNSVSRKLLSEYSASIRPLFYSMKIADRSGINFGRLFAVTEDELASNLSSEKASEEVREKILLLCRIFREITKKYELAGGIAGQGGIPERLFALTGQLAPLKDRLLLTEKSEPVESLYFKRHIAFGIPSVLGTYHEAKFDALAGIFRALKNMTALMEEMIGSAQSATGDFGLPEYRGWIDTLTVMNELLHFYGIGNQETDKALEIIRTNRLHCSQVIDLLRICRKEMVWIVGTITGDIHAPLLHVIDLMPADSEPEILGRLDRKDPDYSNKASDIITRTILGGITGLTELDRFVDAVIRRLEAVPASADDLLYTDQADDRSLTEKPFYLPANMQDMEATRLGPVLGSKAANLVNLINRNISVPYAAVIPASLRCSSGKREAGSELRSALQGAVGAIEKATGEGLGDPAGPLLLSVRSGSYISMPGLMTTILYCGMNTQICNELASMPGKAGFARDSYRRFIEDYAAAVFGLDPAVLGRVMERFIKKEQVVSAADLGPDRMEVLCGLYLETLARNGLAIPQDVRVQLEQSALAVCSSWYGEKALQFRKATAVSEYWGSSVLLMRMVPCNNRGAGASVFFTRNPVTLEKGIYGETREAATGDDLVGGRMLSRPLAKAQETGGTKSLEAADPELFSLHAGLGQRVEEAMGGLPQEVEAAYITGPDGRRDIHALQTRRMEYHPGEARHFEEICRLGPGIIGRGIGVNGGVMSGIAAFAGSVAELKKLKQKYRAPLILMREYSSTADVSLLPYAGGIVTAAGGATSHAAILSRKFGLVAVVGCADMRMQKDKGNGPSAKIGKKTIRTGDAITIDGATGNIYSGICSSPRKAPGPQKRERGRSLNGMRNKLKE